MEIGTERGEGDLPKPLQKQRLGLAKGLFKGCVYSLLDEAARRLRSVAHGKEFGRAECRIDVAQRDLVKRARNGPATAMSSLRSDEACVAQPGHHPTHDSWVGLHGFGQYLGGDRSRLLSHVKQNMEDA